MGCNQADTLKPQGFEWPKNVITPVAEKKPKDMGLHGDSRIDQYYWMNDFFKKGPDSTKVVEYLKAENTYLDTMMSSTRDFQKKLFEEMTAIILKQKENTKNEVLHFIDTNMGSFQKMY